MPTKEQLQKRVHELEEENDHLQDRLDKVYDIVAPADGEDEGGEEARKETMIRGRTDAAVSRRGRGPGSGSTGR